MPRFLVAAVVAAVVALPSTALAAPAALPTVKRTLSASTRSCDTTSYRAPMAGFLTVRDDGTTRGDWDLALVDRRGKATLASSKAFGSREKSQSRRMHHSLRRSSATASSLRVMWNGARSQPLVVLTSISRARPSGSKLAMS